jgi:uncharacterized protein YbjT (DUF2867 family)
MKLAVFGATGGTGRELVEQARIRPNSVIGRFSSTTGYD